MLPISDERATSLDKNNYEFCRSCYAQYLAFGQQVNISIFNDKNELMQELDGINSIEQQDDTWQVKGDKEGN